MSENSQLHEFKNGKWVEMKDKLDWLINTLIQLKLIQDDIEKKELLSGFLSRLGECDSASNSGANSQPGECEYRYTFNFKKR